MGLGRGGYNKKFLCPFCLRQGLPIVHVPIYEVRIETRTIATLPRTELGRHRPPSPLFELAQTVFAMELSIFDFIIVGGKT